MLCQFIMLFIFQRVVFDCLQCLFTANNVHVIFDGFDECIRLIKLLSFERGFTPSDPHRLLDNGRTAVSETGLKCLGNRVNCFFYFFKLRKPG